MEFELTDKYLEIKNSIHDYCQRELAPQAMALDTAPADKALEMVKARISDLGQKGFLGLGFPNEAGGNDGDLLSSTILLQELGQACPATALAVFASVGLCARAIYNWGAASEKEQYLSDLLSEK